MKGLLILIAVIALGTILLKDTPVGEQFKVHVIAIKRYALEIAAERAAAKAQQEGAAPMYAAVDLHQESDTGPRIISRGTPVQIVSLSGDEITVTDGSTIITTSPDSITSIKPAAPALVPRVMEPIQPLPQPEPPPAAPEDPHNVSIQRRIDAIDAQIISHTRTAQIVRGVRGARAQLEIDRLEIQRDNLERQLR